MDRDYSKTVVKYSLKFVRNLGNYESAHIEVGAEDQPHGDENASQAFNRVKDFVESRVLDISAGIDEDLRKRDG